MLLVARRPTEISAGMAITTDAKIAPRPKRGEAVSRLTFVPKRRIALHRDDSFVKAPTFNSRDLSLFAMIWIN